VPDFHRQFCRQPGKRPLGRWKAWQARMPTLEEVVAQWELVPRANVGVVLGPVSGLVGVGVGGPDGGQPLQGLSRGGLPRTPSFATARGIRLLYAVLAGVAVANRTFRRGESEVKILAGGPITVMPPSRHISGKKYGWLRGRGPGHLKADLAPEWIFQTSGPRE